MIAIADEKDKWAENFMRWSDRLKKYFQDYAFLLGIAAVIVVVDQWTKNLVRTQIPFGGSWSPWPWLRAIRTDCALAKH